MDTVIVLPAFISLVVPVTRTASSSESLTLLSVINVASMVMLADLSIDNCALSAIVATLPAKSVTVTSISRTPSSKAEISASAAVQTPLFTVPVT